MKRYNKLLFFLIAVLTIGYLAGCSKSDPVITDSQDVTDKVSESSQAIVRPEEEAQTEVSDTAEEPSVIETASEYEMQPQTPAMTEADLRSVLEDATSEFIVYFICDDFDDDAVLEAFAVTTYDSSEAEDLLSGVSDSLYSYKIWTVSSDGADQMDPDLYRDVFINMQEGTFKTGKKVVLLNNWLSARDYRTYLLTVENGKFVTINTKDDYYISAYITEDGLLKSAYYGFDDDKTDVEEYEYKDGVLNLVNKYTE